MFQKIKDYIASHPNSGVFSTLLFSIATMNTEQQVAFMTAIGMLISGISAAFLQHSRWRQERREKSTNLELLKAQKLVEIKRMEIENNRLELENQAIIRNIETNDNKNITDEK